MAPTPGRSLRGGGRAEGVHRIPIILDLRQMLILAITMLLFLLARLLERARELESEVGEFV